MSFQDILSAPAKNWCDLYVNSITAATGAAATSSAELPVEWTGAFTGVTGTISAFQSGELVTLSFPAFGATATADSALYATAVLGDYAPDTDRYSPFMVQDVALDATIPVQGFCRVYSDGGLGIFSSGGTGGAFQNTFTSGLYPGSVTYKLTD